MNKLMNGLNLIILSAALFLFGCDVSTLLILSNRYAIARADLLKYLPFYFVIALSLIVLWFYNLLTKPQRRFYGFERGKINIFSSILLSIFMYLQNMSFVSLYDKYAIHEGSTRFFVYLFFMLVLFFVINICSLLIIKQTPSIYGSNGL